MSISIPEKEVLRYLGRGRADEKILSLVRSVSRELETSIVPRGIYRRFPAKTTEFGIEAGGVLFESANLAKHLRDCESIYLVAATLGTEADRILRRYAALDIARAAVAQAALAAMIEEYLDDLTKRLSAEENPSGFFLRPRFSPGYGDWNISQQKEIFRLLDCTRRLGITLTQGSMMIPEKSVTAIIGLSRVPTALRNGCETCQGADCAYRRNKNAKPD